MRVVVTGDEGLAAVIRSLVLQSGQTTGDVVDVEIVRGEGPHVEVDGVDGPLEASVVRHVAELAATGKVVLHRRGGVQSDRKLKVWCPESDAQAVGRAIARAIYEFGQVPTPKPIWRFWMIALPFLLATAAPVDAQVQVQTQAGSGGGGGGGAVTVANGADVNAGATTDAAITTDTTGTMSGKLRGMIKWAFERMPASLGQTTMAASLPVAIASDQPAFAVTGTFWPATQPVSNAGTFAVQAAQSGTWVLGANSGIDIGDVTLNNPSIPVTGTFWQATQPVSMASVPVHDVTNAGTFAVQCTSGCGSVSDATASGSITAVSEAVTLSGLNGAMTVSLNISGTWSGSLDVEGSMDGSTYELLTYGNDGSFTSTPLFTANATNVTVNASGLVSVRVIASSWTSGTANVALRASTAGPTFLTVFDNNLSSILSPFSAKFATAAAAADNTANPNVTKIGNYNHVWDAADSNWDRWTGAVSISPSGNEVMIMAAGGTAIEAATSTPVGTESALIVRNIPSGTQTVASGATGAGVPGEAVYIAGTNGANLTPFYVDPCQREGKTFAPFSISTATTTQIVAAVSSQRVFVCSINIVTSGANNVALVEDDTAACASPTAGMAGGVTAATGWNFAANGGLTLGNGGATVLATAGTTRYVCLISSAATQLSGTLSYVLEP